MRVTARLFASLRDAVGEERTAVELPAGARAGDAWEVLCRRYPALAKYENHVLMAVNRRYVSPADPLMEGDELALFPPVSGG